MGLYSLYSLIASQCLRDMEELANSNIADHIAVEQRCRIDCDCGSLRRGDDGLMIGLFSFITKGIMMDSGRASTTRVALVVGSARAARNAIAKLRIGVVSVSSLGLASMEDERWAAARVAETFSDTMLISVE
ncbi:hypothetical protein Scep_001473 [Stephania cephalantha]|uniref:Uncharacterized protein n=1 Tax=Stephania cephalantha TaxID=152367 RepID=A0AAP0Q3D9_9MAGN